MIIKENTQAVLRLLDDIIDISKIEANEIVIKKEAVPLAELFSELNIVYHSYFKRRQKRNLKVIFTLPTEARNEIIFTDSYRLKQILNNLYLNALDRTEQGHIEVGYEILDGQIIRFFVSDNGYGIPPEEVKNLFNRHNIINESISSYDNSGLGLPICKNLAKALGGDILVKSDIDHGSTFYFTLPIEKLELPNVKQFEKIEKRNGFDFSHYHILVADDKPFNLSFFGNLIEKTGAKIFWAKDGIDILNIFKNYKIDLILMDIELAEINGFDVAAEIRRYNSEVPIIVQSTFLKVDDQQKCYDIGCNDILIQPLNENDVLTVISKYLK
jgi:two-component system sensor histidine kinase/response regulator